MIDATWRETDEALTVLFPCALKIANEVLADPRFGTEILNAELIETNGLISDQVLDRIRQDVECRLATWRPWNPWTSAVAYCEAGVIYFNVRKRWAAESMAATLIHERCHLSDCDFKHPFRWSRTRDQTVPYAAGIVAERVIKMRQIQ